MALLPLSAPGTVVGAGRSLFGWATEVVDVAVRLPARVDGLLDEATRLVGVLGDVAERVDGLLDRADSLVRDLDAVLGDTRRIVTGADDVMASARSITSGAEEVVGSARSVTSGAREVVDGARTVTEGASGVVDAANTTSSSAQELLTTYQPMLERGAPLAERFVNDLTPEEVDAAIKLVDQLPVFTEHMVTDILPILATLDRVGPDIHELLEVTRELRQAIDGIPGLGLLKKRGASKDDD